MCKAPTKSLLLGSVLLSGLGLGSVAFAQTQLLGEQPTSLVPLTQPTAPQPTLEELIPSQAITSGGVQIDSLGGLDFDTVGTLDLGQGGFGYDMWRQSSLQDVYALISNMPAQYSSRTGHSLARRLLLSSAGRPLDDRPLKSEEGLLALRLEKLAAMGAYADLDNLLQRVPARSDNETQAKIRTDSLLMVGKHDEACQVIQGMAGNGQDSYWTRAMVFCHLFRGATDQALLGIDLLRETGTAEDPLFRELALAGAGVETKFSGKSSGTVQPLHWAMSELSKSLLPAELDAFLDPGVRLALAGSQRYPADRRVAAAEAATMNGEMTAEQLVNLYSAYEFPVSELDSVVSSELIREGTQARALFLQAAQLQTVPAARAEIIKAALDHAEKDGLGLLMSRVIAPLVGEIPPSADLAWFALPAGKTLYVAGNRPRGDEWLLLARQYMLSEPTAAASLTGLWPYARLSGLEGGDRYGTLKGWASAQGGTGPEVLNQQLVLLRSCMQGLGEDTRLSWGELASLELSTPGLAPSAALLYALKDAQNGNRLAEVVLLSLIILGEEGPGDTHSLALGNVVEALYSVGLPDDARALAIEAAALSGI
ncbi:hypothetical protein [Kiloniella laminariae]|uniref:hypothetical protein n=1 Tax=Kiloniella laminariae TaxID=454162 RepID=UPI00037AB3B6|nr:hypothetical protein [Kiloniella laminariae]